MNRRLATGLATSGGLVSLALLGGCADLMQRSTIAPEWFQAKAMEVKGEGYPDLRGVPKTPQAPKDQAQWKKDAAEIDASVAKLDAQLAAAEPIPTDEEIRARAAQLRARLEDPAAPEAASPQVSSKITP